MKILLTNDDGYEAEGIRVLEEVLKERGHEISVCAPYENQSGKSHSMTLGKSLYVMKKDDAHFVLSGTPADCVIYSHKANILPFVPDVVIAGVNHGYNAGIDVIYSGTCAAARQASLYGFKAIAISATNSYRSSLLKAATFVAANLSYFLSIEQEDAFLNINVPSSFSGKYMFCSLNETQYKDSVDVREKGKDLELRITGEEVFASDKEEGDFNALLKGIASLSIVDNMPSVRKVHS